MVLELKVPEGSEWSDLIALLPKFLSYILSFMMVLIYWNNHHHVFQTVEKVNGKILLANGALLFFLSLIPFATAWMGEHHFQPKPVAFIGVIFFMSGWMYALLTRTIVKSVGSDSVLAKAVGRNYKEIISEIGYFIGIVLAFFYPYVSVVIYLLIALMWFIPDKRIEKAINN